jgi:plastocyanin
MQTRGWLLLTAGVVALASAVVAREDGPRPERHEIAMRAFAFEPAVLEASPGDTLVWINQDIVPHTATSGEGSIDSGLVAPGASWSFVVPAVAHLTYICIFHPTMTGTISVR